MSSTQTMEDTQAIPSVAERHLKNYVSLRQSISNSLVMAYRSVCKMRRTPEQFFDVTLQPIIFTLMFTYIFGGAIAGDIQRYLPIISWSFLDTPVLLDMGRNTHKGHT